MGLKSNNNFLKFLFLINLHFKKITMKNNFKLILLFLSLFFLKNTFSQSSSFSVTACYGANMLLSDIKSDVSGSGGMGIYYSPINALDAGFAFNMGSFSGSDNSYIYNNTTGVNFLTTFYEYGLKVKYNLYSFIDPNPFCKFALHFSTGIGYIDFRDRLEDVNGNFMGGFGYLNSVEIKSKSTTEIYIPIGLSFKYRIDKHYAIAFEPVFSWCNTDKLDYVKGNVKKDHYLFFPLSFEYKLYSKN